TFLGKLRLATVARSVAKRRAVHEARVLNHQRSRARCLITFACVDQWVFQKNLKAPDWRLRMFLGLDEDRVPWVVLSLQQEHPASSAAARASCAWAKSTAPYPSNEAHDAPQDRLLCSYGRSLDSSRNQ